MTVATSGHFSFFIIGFLLFFHHSCYTLKKIERKLNHVVSRFTYWYRCLIELLCCHSKHILFIASCHHPIFPLCTDSNCPNCIQGKTFPSQLRWRMVQDMDILLCTDRHFLHWKLFYFDRLHPQSNRLLIGILRLQPLLVDNIRKSKKTS